MEIEIGEIILEEEIRIEDVILNEEINIDKIELDVIEVEGLDIERYRGDYIITPLAYEEQELETRNKLLEDNITVKEIPYYRVSNIDGTTVYIGSEV